MRWPVYIQRLLLPDPTGISNMTAFGGGNGGFSPEELDAFLNVFAFDYMGNVRFEHGAVAEAYRVLKSSDRVGGLVRGNVILDHGVVVYYICLRKIEQGVRVAVSDLAYQELYWLAETCGLAKVFRGEIGPESPVGWLCIDEENQFMFFSDKRMYENVARLLMP